MKNYYKILGVKKDASEEEIREHWVELMRKLHPDQRIEGTAEDERIKEINEAYQVLKHSSTRVEYDLKRAYDRRKRNSYLRRLSIPIAIFVVLVMIGTLYLRKSQITLQANLPTQNRVNQIDQTNQINQIDQPDQNPVISNQRAVISYQTNQINQKDQSNQKDQRNKPVQKAESSKQKVENSNQKDQKNEIDPVSATDPSTLPHIHAFTHEPNDPMTPKMERRNDPSSRRRIHSSTPLRFDASTDSRIDSIDPTPQQSVVASPHSRIDASTHQRLDASSHSHFHASTPLIATEEEVRGFFGNYTERYTQKDLDSFISLFSSRAIQNRQDGLEGIRQIYGNFLKQSQEIKYDIDHIKIEIYQNGIEVKARYELVQMVKKSGDKRIWRGDIRWSLIKEDGALKILSLDYQHQKSP